MANPAPGAEDTAATAAAAAAAAASAQADSTPSRAAAAKDRECPYCHEFFTSSSLGRHLDQFIKDDKPKQPDGKHDVDEIQRLRGSVTRRQARSGSGKRGSNVHGGQDERRESSTPQLEATPAAKRQRLNGPDSPYVRINRPNWLTTGVISDAGADAAGLLPRPRRREPVDFEEQQRLFAAERDEGRAAKLALTEVIDSIKASVATGGPSSPFHFDFLAQPFPTLVLHLLPPQRTIASAQVIPSADAWPIDPPGEAHLKLLRERVSKQLGEFTRAQAGARRRRRRASGSGSEDDESTASTASSPPSSPTSGPEPEPAQYAAHLEAAWAAWAAMPAAERTKLWHLSALRAFVQEQRGHEATKARLEAAEQQLAHQAAQVRRLSSLQQPREYLLTPTTATPLPPSAAHAVVRRLMAERDGEGATRPARALSADSLIAKWKPSVQSNRNFQRPLLAVLEAAAAAVASAPEPDGPAARDRSSGAEMGAPNGAAADLHSQLNEAAGAAFADLGGVRAGDSADASGDEDDGGGGAAHGTTNGLDTSVLDPTLRAAGGDGGRDDGEFGAEGLLAKVGAQLGATPGGSLRKRRR